MKAADAKQYADALDLVESQRKAGALTDGEADVWRARLLAEMAEKPRPLWARLLIGIFYVILLLIVVRVVVYLL
jgi:cytochrome c-type biogenesis protein CcmH/NrfG